MKQLWTCDCKLQRYQHFIWFWESDDRMASHIILTIHAATEWQVPDQITDTPGVPSAPHATDSADSNLNCAKLEPDPRWPDQWTQKYVTQNIHCLRSLMIDIREIINQSWHVSDSNDIKWIIGPSSSQSQRLETALPSQTCYSITDRIYEAQQSSSFLVTHQFLTCITHHTLQAEQIVTP